MTMERRRRDFHRGRWAVQRERLRMAGRRPPATFEDARPIQEILPGLIRKAGLETEMWHAELQEEWERLVGKAVAAHTRPGRIDGRKLVVFVDSAVWLNELKRYGKSEMLKNLQARFGAGRIEVVVLEPDPER